MLARLPSSSADRNTMVHGGHELRALSANHLGKLPDHAALRSHGRTSVRIDAAVPHLEALVVFADRTGKACAGRLEQHRLFLGINALCWERRDEILGTQFRRIAEVQTMIRILQGTVTAYVISIPGRIRAAGGDGMRVNAEFASRSHHGMCSCAPMDHQMGLIIKRSFSLGE